MTSAAYEFFRKQGYALAGDPGDLRQRAYVYYRMYQDSGQRNVFPLIAAHGALWATGYLRKGLWGGWLCSLAYCLSPTLRKAKLRSVAALADKFRHINRRVFAESYALYHYTRLFGDSGFIRAEIGDDFTDILCECHASNEANSDFPQAKREKLFSAFFNWEQENIVAPFVAEAFANIDWPVIEFLARRPRIDFPYFGRGFHVKFSDFASQDERVARGLQAYRRAEEVGLGQVERCMNEPVITQAGFGYCPSSLRKLS